MPNQPQCRSRRIQYKAVSAKPPHHAMAAQAMFILRGLASAYPRALTIPEIAVLAEKYGMSTRQLPELVVRYYLPLLVHLNLITKEPHHEDTET